VSEDFAYYIVDKLAAVLHISAIRMGLLCVSWWQGGRRIMVYVVHIGVCRVVEGRFWGVTFFFGEATT